MEHVFFNFVVTSLYLTFRSPKPPRDLLTDTGGPGMRTVNILKHNTFLTAGLCCINLVQLIVDATMVQPNRVMVP